MRHLHTFSLSLLVSAAWLPAQVALDSPPAAPEAVLDALRLDQATIQQLALPADLPPSFEVQVVLGGDARTLRLRSHSMRAAGYKLLLDDGARLTEVEAPAPVTYRGTVLGDPDSRVAAGLVAGQLQAVIVVDGEMWGIQPATDAIASLPFAAHVVFRAADASVAGACGFDGTAALADPAPAVSPPSSALLEAEIAIDVNNPLYLIWQSNPTLVQSNIDTTMNAVDVIYTRDVETTYKITAVIIRTSSVYTSSSSALLGQFSNRWIANHASIQRDVAHMFTGRSSSSLAGIANLSAICSQTRGYGITWHQSTTVVRAGVAAHELGHNWSAQHCDGTVPCYIMCSVVNACSRNITKFAPISIGRIMNHRATRTCLSNPVTAPPTLTSLTPNQCTSHEATQIVVQGTELGALTSLQIGSLTLTPGQFTVVDPSTITFMTPAPFEIATHQVSATNSLGTSNQLPLQVDGTHPSELLGPTLHLRGFPLDYTVHSDRNWFAALFLSTSNVPSVFPGLVSLDIGNNFAELFSVVTLVADTTGTATLPLTLPTSLPAGLPLYFQAVTFLTAVTPLESSNPITVTTF